MPRTRKPWWIVNRNRIVIALAAAVTGLLLYGVFSSYHNAQKRAELELRAAESDGKASTYWLRYNDELKAKEALYRANAELEAKIASMKVTPKPPPVPNPPEPSEAQKDLAREGMEKPEALTPKDTGTVWTWCYKAKQVPVLERRSFDLESLLAKKDELLAGKNKELEATNLALNNSTSAYLERTKQAEALKGALEAAKKEAKAKEVKWLLKTGAAALAAYLAGKKL